jgi:anaphase-promoting complex subunit 6
MLLQQQQRQHNESSMDDSSAASSPLGTPGGSYMMGHSLVQARISPANATAAAHSAPNMKSSKRFFDWNNMSSSSSFLHQGSTPTAASAGSAMHAAKHNTPPEPPSQGTTTTSTSRKYGGITGNVAGSAPAVCVDGLNLTHLRALTQSCLGTETSASSSSMAVFYAGIVYAKTQSHEDAFVYAQTLLQNKEAKRCVRLLETTSFMGVQKIEAVLLATEALASLGEWQTVLSLLEDPLQYSIMHNNNNNSHTSPLLTTPPLEDDDDIAWQSLAQCIPTSPDSSSIHPLARICCWRGQAYAETGHPLRAALYWKRALRIDPLCVQALDFLLDRSVCPSDQALEVILQLSFPPQMDWLRALYLARVHVAAPKTSPPSNEDGPEDMMKHHKTTTTDDPFWQEASSIQLLSPPPTNPDLPSDKIFFGETKDESTNALVESSLDTLWNTHKLQKSSEVLAMAAKRAYRRHDLKNSHQYCQELAAVDPLCQTAGFVYVSTLVALGLKRELFRLAHEWVDAAPKSARAWFAVGAYYYTCERFHVAQRHFCRSTRLDPHCSEAWIAFGTSFAACDESDQALASFRAAQRLAPGDHTSLLYIGMEYLRTNHLTLAQHFLQAAHHSSSGTDALCKNELGVLCMAQKNFPAAIRWFLKALVGGGNEETNNLTIDDIPTVLDVYWEPTLFNLGQAYRKTRKFVEASKCFQRCLTLQESSSAYAALAFCKHLQGDFDAAIDTYHQSLSRKPDDPFCSEMLHRCLQDALEQNNLMGEDPQQQQLQQQALPQHQQHQHHPAVGLGTPIHNHNQKPQSSSLWTDDGEGLSISVESNTSDVDMG